MDATVLVFVIVDLRSGSDQPLGESLETFVRREDAERFIDEVRDNDPNLASHMRIEESALEAGGRD